MHKFSMSLVESLFNGLLKVTLTVMLLALVSLTVSTEAAAQQKKTAADPAVAQALRKAQGMLQELADKNAQLSAELAQLQAQVATLAPTAVRLQKSEAELAQQVSAGGELREQYRALVERTHRDADRIRELQDATGKLRQDNSLLVQAVTERQQWIDGCAGKNTELRALNGELLDKYQHKGLWQALKNAEPATGIAQVAEEREVQQYRFRLEDLTATAVPAANAAPGKVR